jgi:hypothetical protein
MKRLLALLVSTGCGGSVSPVVPETPVEWSVEASVDKREVQVGEDLTLTLVLRHPAEGRYVTPPDTKFAPFEVIGKSEETPGTTETRLLVRLAAFRLPDDLEIPALEIQYQSDGKVESLATDPIPVKVVTSLTPEVKEIHGIKDPVDLEIPRDFRLLWWLLLAGLAALLAYLIYRKLRKEPSGVKTPAWVPPLPAPDVEAEAALRRLAEKDLIKKGELNAYYTELSEIVKRYAGRRFDVPYLERTTTEVLFDLKPRRLSPAVMSELGAILEASDLVKFARVLPAAAQAEESLGLAVAWIGKTRAAPPAEPGKAVA